MEKGTDYVAMIPGTGWVAVFTADDMRPEPVLAFKMDRAGDVFGMDGLGREFEQREFFSHYKKVGK